MNLFANLLPPPLPKHKWGMKATPPDQRFEKFVDYNGPLVTDEKKIKIWPELAGTRCHIFTGGHFSNGYGAFYDGKKTVKAHRYIWKKKYSKYPKLEVLHKCDILDCVNILHLFIGTAFDNAKDRDSKDRNGMLGHPEYAATGDRHGSRTHPELIRRGEKHTNSKLTERIVHKIRVDWATREYTTYALAKRYKISNYTIWHIVNNKTWHHVK